VRARTDRPWPEADWHTLIETLLGLHEQQRETALDKRRGHRPRLVNPGNRRRPDAPMLTLADRLMAVILPPAPRP